MAASNSNSASASASDSDSDSDVDVDFDFHFESESEFDSEAPIHYPQIPTAPEPNAPSLPDTAEGQAQAQAQPQPQASVAEENDLVVADLRCLLPPRGTDSCFPGYLDEYYFPSDLCIDWNILHGAPISSFAVASTAAAAARSRAFGENGENGLSSSEVSRVFSSPPIQVDPPLLNFLMAYPTRAMSYMTFLPTLQERFSAEVYTLSNKSSSPYESQRTCLLIGISTLLASLGLAIMLEAIGCDSADASCSVDRVTTITLSSIGLAVGVLFVVCGVAFGLRAKQVFLRAVDETPPLKLCAHSINALQGPGPGIVRDSSVPSREWHGEVRFEATPVDHSITAQFTISWRRCDDQCLHHRVLPHLPEVVVSRSIDGL